MGTAIDKLIAACQVRGLEWTLSSDATREQSERFECQVRGKDGAPVPVLVTRYGWSAYYAANEALDALAKVPR